MITAGLYTSEGSVYLVYGVSTHYETGEEVVVYEEHPSLRKGQPRYLRHRAVADFANRFVSATRKETRQAMVRT